MSPDRESLERLDDAHLWHPFTPHSVWRDEHPLTIAAAEGNELIDVDGKRYLDGVSSIWCAALGHRHPRIDAALREQIDRVAHATLLGNSNVRAIELAARLARLAPGDLSRVFFSDNGSTAVEAALKIAFQYWQQHDGGAQKQRTRFLTLGGAYHGDTIGSVSLGGIDLIHERFAPLAFEVVRLPSPSHFARPLADDEAAHAEATFAEMDAALAEHGDRLAAVIVEPGFQGAAGMLTQPEGWLRRLAEKTREAGAFLVLDEVAVGMGRSGRLFACEREGVEPDFLCLAKGITGGYLPLAATLTTDRVFEAFLGAPTEGRTFFHGHTFTGNPLGAACAMAVLDVFEEELLEELPARCEAFAARIRRLADLPHVADVRTYGMAAGVELMADPATRAAYPPAARMGQRVCGAAVERGVFLRPLGDVVVLAPPLTITDGEIERLGDVLEQAITTVAGDA